METYRTGVRLFELLPYYSWIVDRFHISTQVYQKHVYDKNHDFWYLENRMKKLGFHLVFCTRTSELFAEARNERLKVSGNPSQYDDLNRFIDEPGMFRDFIKKSILPTLELDVSNNDISSAVEKIADWMERTAGLWAK